MRGLRARVHYPMRSDSGFSSCYRARHRGHRRGRVEVCIPQATTTFLLGIQCCPSMLSPLYLAEISSPSLRGSLMALEQLAIVLGVVFGFWLGFITRTIPSSMSWRIPLAVQIIPGLILGIGCIFLPSSPRLLILQGMDDEASRVLAKLRGRSVDNPLVKVCLYIERVYHLLN